MIELSPHRDGVLLRVQARAGGRCNGVTGAEAGKLKVAVTQAAEQGKATKAIVAVLAKALGVKKSQVTLVSGATSPQKRFLIEGVAAEDLQRRIAECIDSL